jgi:hypothetical protein
MMMWKIITAFFAQRTLAQWSSHSHVHEDSPLDSLTRPEKCYGIALADATDFGPY